MTTPRRPAWWKAALVCLAVLAVLAAIVAVVKWRHSESEITTNTPTASTPPGTTEPAQPGAAGIGDPLLPTRGNGGYDVATYDISIAWEPEADLITASETIVATSTHALSAFNIDLHGLTVNAVTIDGVEASFSRAGDELTITPAAAIASNTQFTTVIDYSGTPATQNGEGWLHDGDGGVIVFGEPSGSSTWRPVNDHPLDKAGYTVRITAPSTMLGVSNGTLQSTTPNGDTTTWVYEQPFDAAPYLQFIAIGDYELVERGASSSGIPVRNVFPTERVDELTELFDSQPEMIDMLESYFGPYPFDVYGSLVVDNFPIGTALETQTLSTFSSDPGILTEEVIVHELAHQWFGDSVSIGSWADIWLNEGFATYAEWLWLDAQGVATPTEAICDLLSDPGLADFLGRPITDVTGDDLFTASVYLRGGMLLHALRLEIGDGAFTELLMTYFSRFSNGNVVTSDFIAVAEEVSARQLDDLFDRWLNDPQLPSDFDNCP